MIDDDYAESVEDLIFSIVLAMCAAAALVLMGWYVWEHLEADSSANEGLYEWESGKPPLPPYGEEQGQTKGKDGYVVGE